MAEALGHTAQLENLLGLVRAGDGAARERLIAHACERLRLLTQKMLRASPRVHRWEETDDVFVEALTKLHRSLEAVKPVSAKDFYSLAATQIRRVLIDLARRYSGPRRAGGEETVEWSVPDPTSVPSGGPTDRSGEPVNLLEWTEFHEQVASLPEEEHEVFSLLWYAGLTQEEAAQALGISQRTLRRRWQQARIRLYQARQGERPPE